MTFSNCVTEGEEEVSLTEGEREGSATTITDEFITPGEILNKLGPRNPFLLSCVLITGLTWTVEAMNGMSTAFITQSCENCSNMVSLVDEYDLRGSRAYISDATITAFMIGNGFGGTFVSKAADRYGRRPVLISCFVMLASLGTLAAFSPSVMVFGILRFMQGIFYTGGALVGWVLGYECTPVKLRFFTSVYFGMAWVTGYCLVTPLAMLAPNWRWLIFFVSVPQLFTATLCYFFVPESLHFLAIERHENVVGDWLKKAGRCHDSVADIDPSTVVSTRQEEPKVSNLFSELWTHKRFLLYTIVLIYLWNCDTFIYFGLSLYSTHFAGNIYLNYLLVGLVEIPAYILSPMAMNRYGRRVVVALTHLLAAGTFFGLVFTPETAWIRTALWALGKFAISCSFMSIYVYASEIFPTNIRNLSIGFCEMMSRIGGILAPYVIVLVGSYLANTTDVGAVVDISNWRCDYVFSTRNSQSTIAIDDTGIVGTTLINE
uniref:MFS domain-containing protein n=1 Tax=Haemonchus contortus TaxID=6289 RepID=A0A7I4Y840_HAECO